MDQASSFCRAKAVGGGTADDGPHGTNSLLFDLSRSVSNILNSYCTFEAFSKKKKINRKLT